MKTLLYSFIYASIAFVIIVPTLIFFSDSYSPSDLFLFLGATTGLVLFVVMFWQYVLSLKILTKFLNLNLSSVIALHKDLGIYSVMLLLTHPIFLGVDSLLGSGYLHIFPNFASTYDFRVFLGELALLLFLFTWFVSYIIKKNLTFRFWKKLHLFAYLVLPITYLHADDIGSFISNPILNIFIKGVTFVFMLMVLARFIDASGYLKYKYVVKSKRLYADILEITFTPQNIASRIFTKMGQFVYIQLKAFGEGHPYSVLWNDAKTGDLTLGIKLVGEFGNRVNALEVNTIVYLDGPHGQFLKGIENKSHVVFIAGGIGVTPFVEFAGNSNQIDSVKRIDFFYATRSINDSVFINKNSMAHLPKVNLVNILSNKDAIASEPKVELGFFTFELLTKYLQTRTMDCDYYICGPTPMMTAVTAQLLNNNISEDKIHLEEFGW